MLFEEYVIYGNPSVCIVHLRMQVKELYIKLSPIGSKCVYYINIYTPSKPIS